MSERSLKSFGLPIIWGVALVYLSSTTGLNLPDMNLMQPDKFFHAGAYGLFTLLILRSYYLYNGKQEVKWIPQVLTAFFISAGWGFLMELMQYSFFPGRFFDLYDEIANIIGTILSIGIFKLLLKL